MGAESLLKTRLEQEAIQVAEGLSTAEDDQLVEEAIRGSDRAFGLLFQRYERRLFHATFRVLHNREDSEDAVQQAFEKAFVHLKSFQRESRFSTWLTRIAINEALMQVRRRRTRHSALDENKGMEEEGALLDIVDKAATPEERCGEQELRLMLSEAIAELKPIFRSVVQLREIAEMTDGKTAEVLGLPLATVKARAFRARRVLRRKLARRLGADGRKATATLSRESAGNGRNLRQGVMFAGAL